MLPLIGVPHRRFWVASRCLAQRWPAKCPASASLLFLFLICVESSRYFACYNIRSRLHRPGFLFKIALVTHFCTVLARQESLQIYLPALRLHGALSILAMYRLLNFVNLRAFCNFNAK